MSEPVEVLYLYTCQPVKDPYRSHGIQDQMRGFSPTEEINGKLVQVRKMFFRDGVFFIEATYGDHEGQTVATGAANVQWARFQNSKKVEAARRPVQKARVA